MSGLEYAGGPAAGITPTQALARLAELAARDHEFAGRAAVTAGDPRALRSTLQERRLDPAERRQAARIQTANRLRQEQLLLRLRGC
ncbi:hypothetical protein ACFXJ5_17035 [Streptomyces sp. NPDC059373]